MGDSELEQRLRLEAEGVRFDARGRVSLKRYGWTPLPADLRRRSRKPEA
jgi:alkylated DNA nucleotide flippase Atl1